MQAARKAFAVRGSYVLDLGVKAFHLMGFVRNPEATSGSGVTIVFYGCDSLDPVDPEDPDSGPDWHTIRVSTSSMSLTDRFTLVPQGAVAFLCHNFVIEETEDSFRYLKIDLLVPDDDLEEGEDSRACPYPVHFELYNPSMANTIQ